MKFATNQTVLCHLDTHHHFAGYAKFGDCTVALTSETTTFASVAFVQQKAEGQSETKNEENVMKQPEQANKVGVKANIVVTLVAAALVLVTVVGVLGASPN